jgi:hypothetical protein
VHCVQEGTEESPPPSTPGLLLRPSDHPSEAKSRHTMRNMLFELSEVHGDFQRPRATLTQLLNDDRIDCSLTRNINPTQCVCDEGTTLGTTNRVLYCTIMWEEGEDCEGAGGLLEK